MKQQTRTRPILNALTADEIECINECIGDYNCERPDDEITAVNVFTSPKRVNQIIRYLGINFSHLEQGQ